MVPGWHAVQTDAPVLVLTYPYRVLNPEKSSREQARHAVLPVIDMYLPISQTLQVLSWTPLAYDPAEH
jgi:hypothetical protein